MHLLMCNEDIAKVHRRHPTHISRLMSLPQAPTPVHTIGRVKLYEPEDIDKYFSKYPIARRKRKRVKTV
jgi:hypothetical protein